MIDSFWMDKARTKRDARGLAGVWQGSGRGQIKKFLNQKLSDSSVLLLEEIKEQMLH